MDPCNRGEGDVRPAVQKSRSPSTWQGGRLFDVTGSYDITWWIAVALGLVAAALHYPIDERPLGRAAPA